MAFWHLDVSCYVKDVKDMAIWDSECEGYGTANGLSQPRRSPSHLAPPAPLSYRFSAIFREYKYFVLQHHLPPSPTPHLPLQQQQQLQAQQQQQVASSAGAASSLAAPVEAELDLGRMQAAAALLVGDHDFRNFCKPDVLAVKSFRCVWGGGPEVAYAHF